MPFSVGRMMALDRQLDAEIDGLALQFQVTLGTVINRWRELVMARVTSFPITEGAFKDTAKALRQTENLDTKLAIDLDAAGWAEVSERGLLRLTRLGQTIGQGMSLTGRPMPQNSTLLTAFFRMKGSQLSGLGAKMTLEVSEAISRGVLSGETVSEVLIGVEEIVGKYENYAKTLYDTACSELAQLLTAAGTGPEDVFLYSGPIDTRCRPFCLRIVGKVFSRKAIDRMDNGQLPNTMLTRGGYNCRHQWRPVTNVPHLAVLADSQEYALSSFREAVGVAFSLRKRGQRPARSV